jgi:hypothetical protein
MIDIISNSRGRQYFISRVLPLPVIQSHLTKVVLFTLLGSISLVPAEPIFSQQLPEFRQPEKGDTISISVQSGSRSSLTFGSNSTIGTSASLTSTDGVTSSATSTLAPYAGSTLTFTVGAGSDGGVSSATIDNIRMQGEGISTFKNINVNANEASLASGSAKLDGIQSIVFLPLDAARTGFVVNVDSTPDSSQSSQSGNSSYIGATSGTASLSSNTSVEINNSSFSSVFMQAF